MQLLSKGQEISGCGLHFASFETAGGNTSKTCDALNGLGPAASHISDNREQTVRDHGGPSNKSWGPGNKIGLRIDTQKLFE